MLERNALADLWKHTLSQIPNTYGRLAYLASLRDPNSGSYRHYGLSAAFGREDSTLALRKSHEDTFLEWLQMPLSAKTEALRAHLQTSGGTSADGDDVFNPRYAVPEPNAGFRQPCPTAAISE